MAAELSSSSNSSNQKITTTVLDVRKSAEVNDWIEQTAKDHGRLDGAANLAGVLKPTGSTMETSDEDFEFIMSTNCTVSTASAPNSSISPLREGLSFPPPRSAGLVVSLS